MTHNVKTQVQLDTKLHEPELPAFLNTKGAILHRCFPTILAHITRLKL